MNTQRFYILVKPENFDIALGIYDKLRREKKAYGAGLINTQKMEDYDKVPQETLATVVKSKNKYAKRFINMILGKVQMCERYSDLKKYPTSITKECMKYQNRVASAIRPEIFNVPFIGKNAFKIQLEQARQARTELEKAMKQAQSEFKELNKALKDIAFSNEKYEFLFMPSKKYRNYYEMIMDDFNMVQGEPIFSGIFHETHKEVIDELFDRLAIHNENQAKTLDEFTDYRTYMDYDIKILHSDNSYSYYSKVCEEKSGGETQTPFYVTVAASFVQLYSNNIGGGAVGLVMFDEAFNNMDDERIGGVLEFLQRLPLQIVIAAPPDKIQYIGPSLSETLLIMTDEKVSYVEGYYNGTV